MARLLIEAYKALLCIFLSTPLFRKLNWNNLSSAQIFALPQFKHTNFKYFQHIIISWDDLLDRWFSSEKRN